MEIKKSAIKDNYLIGVFEDGSIEVFSTYDNIKGALREAADSKGFAYEKDWTTRQFGSKLCKEFGNGKRAEVGEYIIRVLENGSIDAFRKYDNVKGALREISEKVGFSYDTNWNTRQFGSKLVDFLNGK